MSILEAIKVLEGLKTVEYVSDKQIKAIDKAIAVMKLYVSLSKAEMRNATEEGKKVISEYIDNMNLGVNIKEL